MICRILEGSFPDYERVIAKDNDIRVVFDRKNLAEAIQRVALLTGDRARAVKLDFDGEKDSIYHPLDLEGRRHMEYLRNRGEYHEPPVDQILSTYQKEYPAWQIAADGISGDFDTDVDIETLNSYR